MIVLMRFSMVPNASRIDLVFLVVLFTRRLVYEPFSLSKAFRGSSGANHLYDYALSE